MSSDVRRTTIEDNSLLGRLAEFLRADVRFPNRKAELLAEYDAGRAPHSGTARILCVECDGSGQLSDSHSCSTCRGTGLVPASLDMQRTDRYSVAATAVCEARNEWADKHEERWLETDANHPDDFIGRAVVDALDADRTRPPEAARSPDGADLGEFTMQDGQLTGSTLKPGLTGRYKIIPADAPSPDPRGRSGDDPLRVAAGHVHVAHCCIKHGCKYGDSDCPVASGELAGDGSCESCADEPATTGARAEAVAWLVEDDDTIGLGDSAYPGAFPVYRHPAPPEVTHCPIVEDKERSEAFDAIERYLRNSLDDAQYQEYVAYLQKVWDAPEVTHGAAIGARAEAVAYMGVYSGEHRQFAQTKDAFGGTDLQIVIPLYTAPPEVTHGAAIGGDVVTEWISVDDRLPAVDEWVQVLEDDNTNPHDAFIGKLVNPQRALVRVRPARMLGVDREGYPLWYLAYCGSSPMGEYNNVTHWHSMARATASTRSDGGDVGRDAG